MTDSQVNQTDALSAVLPTYSTLTAQSILAHFGIKLDHVQLLSVIKNQENVYFQLLRVPFTNIANSIVLQQAYDYQIYVQKLFIDYLMSGEGNADNEGSGRYLRDGLEDERRTIVDTGKDFEDIERSHKLFIAESQTLLIKFVKDNAGNLDSKYQSISEVIRPLIQRADDIGEELRGFRKTFKESIVKVKQMLENLPEYKVNFEQDEINLSSIKFDDQVV